MRLIASELIANDRAPKNCIKRIENTEEITKLNNYSMKRNPAIL